jgi:hypothetical protein
MMIKSCFKTGECDPSFVRSCAHAMSLQVDVNHFFSPRHTGEFCDHYSRIVEDDDLVEKLSRMAGSHE